MKVVTTIDILNIESRIKLFRKLIKRPTIYIQNYLNNTKLLKEHGWYRAVSGNYVDSHAMQIRTINQLCELNVEFTKEILF